MEDETYRRFRSARQEPGPAQAALDGFFAPDGEDERQKEYAFYLKKRIRPAMETLIRELSRLNRWKYWLNRAGMAKRNWRLSYGLPGKKADYKPWSG